jgi:hypothetical protein
LKAVSFICAGVIAIGCAQLTGLSDDYTFDAPEDGGGGDAADGSSACNADQRGAAPSTLAANGGDGISSTCKTCMAQSCCVQLAACDRDVTCKASMGCVFACQRETNRRECARECRSSFDTVLGPCLQQHCVECTFR